MWPEDNDKDWFTPASGVSDECELAMTYVVQNEGGTMEDVYNVRRLLGGKY
jgi:hypothetical protein